MLTDESLNKVAENRTEPGNGAGGSSEEGGGGVVPEEVSCVQLQQSQREGPGYWATS